MIYAKWIIPLYFTLFGIFFVIINQKTKKKTGLPVIKRNKEVKISVILSNAIFAVVLISMIFSNFYDVFLSISFLQSDFLTIFGLILLFSSLLIGIISAQELGTSWRVGILEDQKTELVQTGIYKFCRNPYFLSYFIMFFAFLLIVPSIVLILLVLITIFWFHKMVKSEEKYLEKVHGSEYLYYCKRVGRYLPKFKVRR